MQSTCSSNGPINGSIYGSFNKTVNNNFVVIVKDLSKPLHMDPSETIWDLKKMLGDPSYLVATTPRGTHKLDSPCRIDHMNKNQLHCAIHQTNLPLSHAFRSTNGNGVVFQRPSAIIDTCTLSNLRRHPIARLYLRSGIFRNLKVTHLGMREAMKCSQNPQQESDYCVHTPTADDQIVIDKIKWHIRKWGLTEDSDRSHAFITEFVLKDSESDLSMLIQAAQLGYDMITDNMHFLGFVQDARDAFAKIFAEFGYRLPMLWSGMMYIKNQRFRDQFRPDDMVSCTSCGGFGHQHCRFQGARPMCYLCGGAGHKVDHRPGPDDDDDDLKDLCQQCSPFMGVPRVCTTCSHGRIPVRLSPWHPSKSLARNLMQDYDAEDDAEDVPIVSHNTQPVYPQQMPLMQDGAYHPQQMYQAHPLQGVAYHPPQQLHPMQHSDYPPQQMYQARPMQGVAYHPPQQMHPMQGVAYHPPQQMHPVRPMQDGAHQPP
eukprot:TRINITY_DN4055_c0_g1_i1.p1 TRINITY_DN4055_c0_g1~~TRINITY_DN4055_c0_g1_i1.p1  ORF type:complete len:484 (-),score=101.32 TRINITY_DN4055_c0_g1_i1:351-1802(-)